jgi:hypothetical protein
MAYLHLLGMFYAHPAIGAQSRLDFLKTNGIISKAVFAAAFGNVVTGGFE